MRYLILLAVLFVNASCSAQFKLPKSLEEAESILTGSSGALTNDEIIKGLKEALTVGTKNSVNIASKVDGFYKNPAIFIPFPPEAKEMKDRLRQMGMGAQVDKFEQTLNRAAEEAAKEAAPVFVSAVKGMTIQDGMTILKGDKHAATNYLMSKTSPELNKKFNPIVQRAIQKVELTRYWEPLATAYNKIPFVQKVNPDLDDYVTKKGIDGLSYLIAREEEKIRENPAARVSDILRKVFGTLD